MTSDEIYELVEKGILREKYTYFQYYEEVMHYVQYDIHQISHLPGFKKISSAVKRAGRHPSQQAAVRVIASFYSDPALLNQYFQSRSPEDRALIIKLTWEGVASYQQAKAMFNQEELVERHSNPRGLALKPEYEQWQPYMHTHPNYDDGFRYTKDLSELIQRVRITFDLPFFFRRAYGEILPKPEGYNLQPIQLPKNARICHLESNIFEELPNILLLYRQGVIKVTQSGYLNIPTVKSTQKKLGLTSFPNDVGHIKLLCIAGFIFDHAKLAELPSPLDMIRFIFKEQRLTYAMMDVLLFAYGGIRSIDRSLLNLYSLPQALDLLKELPEGKWIAQDNLQYYASAHFYNLDMVHENSLYALKPMAVYPAVAAYLKAPNKLRVKYLREQIVSSIVLVAASFGLVELAYDGSERQTTAEEEVAGMPIKGYNRWFSACRLTQLGAYILKDNPEYTLPEGAGPMQLKLAPDALEIKVTGNMEMAKGLLREWTCVLSEDTLQLDLNKIIAKSQSRDSFIYTIRQFFKSLGQNPPDYWKTTLMDWLNKASAIQPVHRASVFKLSPYDKQLHKVIAQDSILRRLTRKGEDFTIIVNYHEEEQFIKRMAQLGYLMQETFEDQLENIHFMSKMPTKAENIKDFNQSVLPKRK